MSKTSSYMLKDLLKNGITSEEGKFINLKPGKEIDFGDNRTLKVVKKVARGTQGEFYLFKIFEDSQDYGIVAGKIQKKEELKTINGEKFTCLQHEHTCYTWLKQYSDKIPHVYEKVVEL